MPATSPRLSFLSLLWPFLRPYRRRVFIGLFALVAAASLMLGIGQALRIVIDQGFGAGGNPDFLNHALLGMIIVAALLAMATYARAYTSAWLSQRAIADIRQRLFDHLLTLDATFFETIRTGDLVARITSDTATLESAMGQTASMAIRNTLLLIGGIVLLAMTSPKLTGIVLLVVPMVVLPMAIFRRRLHAMARDSQDQLAGVGAETAERLGALRTVQAFTGESHVSRLFNVQNEATFESNRIRTRTRSMLVGLVIFMVFATVGIILWIGGRDVMNGTITAGQLSSFVFYSVLVASNVASLSEVMADIERAAGATSRIFELLQMRPRITSPAHAKALPQPVQGAIAFKNVTFSYPATPQRGIIENVNLTVAPGEVVAVVGPSGAGKTTLFNLLLRFYDPAQGLITLDGTPIGMVPLNALRQAIALVPQDPVLFSGSIRDNILFGRPGASDADIKAVADAAQATEFIERLPHGMHTVVGERGVRLSGGQRQRIAIARTLLRNPPVLLLDEATSALDAANEQLVQKALEQVMKNRTTIIVAHRLATVRAAHRIVVMEHGQIVDEGRHDELVAKGGLYAGLAKLQFQD